MKSLIAVMYLWQKLLLCHNDHVVSRESIQYCEGHEQSDASIFKGYCFGVNVCLRAQINHDLTYSVISVHVDGINYSV